MRANAEDIAACTTRIACYQRLLSQDTTPQSTLSTPHAPPSVSTSLPYVQTISGTLESPAAALASDPTATSTSTSTKSQSTTATIPERRWSHLRSCHFKQRKSYIHAARNGRSSMATILSRRESAVQLTIAGNTNAVVQGRRLRTTERSNPSRHNVNLEAASAAVNSRCGSFLKRTNRPDPFDIIETCSRITSIRRREVQLLQMIVEICATRLSEVGFCTKARRRETTGDSCSRTA